jgi:hypothetical protein
MKTILILILITIGLKIPAQGKWDLVDSLTPAQISIIDGMGLHESSRVSDTTNKKENAVGYLGIRPIMLDEVNNAIDIFKLPYKHFSLEDRKNKHKSIQMFCIYQTWRNKYWRNEKHFKLNLMFSTMLWNGGASGIHKKTAVPYYLAVLNQSFNYLK